MFDTSHLINSMESQQSPYITDDKNKAKAITGPAQVYRSSKW